MKKQLIIPDESFDAVMDELSIEAHKILDELPDKREIEAAVVWYCTLKQLAMKRFQYWPEEDRADLLAMCGTWMNVGILLGRSPRLLADILKKTRSSGRGET